MSLPVLKASLDESIVQLESELKSLRNSAHLVQSGCGQSGIPQLCVPDITIPVCVSQSAEPQEMTPFIGIQSLGLGLLPPSPEKSANMGTPNVMPSPRSSFLSAATSDGK